MKLYPLFFIYIYREAYDTLNIQMEGNFMRMDLYEKITSYMIENQTQFYRLAYSYVRDQEDALDAVQNAVCKALEHYGSLKNEQAIKTWFYRILVNESLMIIRERKKETLCDEKEWEIPFEEKGYDTKEDLYEQIHALEEPARTIIKLRFFEELSLKEIAQITGLKLNTVKTKLYRGLKLIKENIEEVDV